VFNELIDCGVDVKKLSSNKWVADNELKPPFKRFVLLYNDSFQPDAIGVY